MWFREALGNGLIWLAVPMTKKAPGDATILPGFLSSSPRLPLVISPPRAATRVAMSHTFQHRLNALLTFAVTTLAVLCLLASITDEFHRSDPVADVRVLEIERFASVGRNDEAYLVFSVDADLRSCFSWNTKQLFVSVQAEYEIDHPHKGRLTNVVSIWDRVVESKKNAVLNVPRARNKYKLKDRGHHLRGARVNVTMQWNVMPIAGRVRAEKRVFPGVTFPDEYSEPNDERNALQTERGSERRRAESAAPRRQAPTTPRREEAETEGNARSDDEL